MFDCTKCSKFNFCQKKDEILSQSEDVYCLDFDPLPLVGEAPTPGHVNHSPDFSSLLDSAESFIKFLRSLL